RRIARSAEPHRSGLGHSICTPGARVDFLHGRRNEGLSTWTIESCAQIFPAVRRHLPAGLVSLDSRSDYSVCGTHCRRAGDNWLACSRGAGGAWLCVSDRDVWTSAQRAAIRVPHACDTASRIIAVCFFTACSRRSLFVGLHPGALEE